MKYQKGTFSVTPNKEHLKGKPAPFQSIFFWVCEHADDDGICYPTRKTLAKEAGCDIKTVDKYLLQMEIEGFLTKTTRNKPNSKEKTSNLYQVCILEEVAPITEVGSTENGVTPSPENGAVTIPITNQPNITTITTTGKLPETRGKTYILRVLSVYRDLFRDKYSADPTVDMGRWGKSLKKLMETKTELQIAALLITFFNWHGMDGGDNFAYNKLLGAAFNPQWFFSTVTQYEIYLRNVFHLKLDDESEVRDFVRKNLLALNK